MKNEHDFTVSSWGHNINILNWDKTERKGRAACWVTPGLRDGDIVIVKSEKGSMRLVASNVTRAPNVSDMYFFDMVPEELESRSDEEGMFVTMVRRYGGGTSIIDVATSFSKAKALADEFNEQYQTDNYYVEPYKEELHAHSRNG